MSKKPPAPPKVVPIRPGRTTPNQTKLTAAKQRAKAKKPAKRAPRAPAPVEAPSAWDQFKADPNAAMSEVVACILEGGHLSGFCKAKGFPYMTVSDWLNADPARAVTYARAREDRSDLLAEQLVTLADEDCSTPITADDGEGNQVEIGRKVDPGRVAQLKLKADNLKWVASKLKPKSYGDKLTVDQNLNVNDMSDVELTRRLAAFGVVVPALPVPGGTQ